MQYNFEWDPAKGKVNIGKHGVSFERAAEIFLDPLQLTIFDDDHSESEERWITLGKEKTGTLLVVTPSMSMRIMRLFALSRLAKLRYASGINTRQVK